MRTTVRLPDDLGNRLRLCAEERHESLNAFVIAAVTYLCSKVERARAANAERRIVAAVHKILEVPNASSA